MEEAGSNDEAAGPGAAEERHLFPCPRCGGDLRFSPSEGRLICDHCGYRESIETDPAERSEAIRELDFRAALEARLPEAEAVEIRTVSCPNCGAVIEIDGDTHAAECPYCATPVVLDTGTTRQIKPRAVLPFALDESAAREAMTEWLGSLWFAPNGLKQYARKGRRMIGIYMPFWTFDADTESTYRGERGTVYYVTRTRTVNGKTRTVREQRIRWTPKSGRVARFFDDVLVLASRALPRKYTEALEPWDLAALEPYRPDFLAGFRAEAYTVELDEAFQLAREKMDRVIERDVRFDIGGDRQRIHEINTTIRDVTFKHILLPVWTAAYKYRGKSYRFVVNGRSGRVQGERPWSAWKIALAVIAGLIIAGTVGYLIAQNQ
ncbi:MAG: primosomal protein N' (replication factor Y) - superfamily II helicase [Alphaproteobacteria bacterium]|nr:MAG: primosomal protein N' (replication factor Y) - superfamily II helicase [Alphaproteobacteria bacterium]